MERLGGGLAKNGKMVEGDLGDKMAKNGQNSKPYDL